MIFIRIEHDPDALEESPDSFGLPLFPRATAYSLGVFCLSRLNYSRAPLSPGSRAWKWKRTSGVLQPGPALLRAHPTWCFFAQHLHVHAHLPRRPGLWLPPAAPSLPHRRALRRIRTQRAGSGWQHEDGGTTEKSIPFFFSSVSVCYLFILLTKTDLFFTGHWSVRVHGDWSQLKCTLWWGK